MRQTHVKRFNDRWLLIKTETINGETTMTQKEFDSQVEAVYKGLIWRFEDAWKALANK